MPRHIFSVSTVFLATLIELDLISVFRPFVRRDAVDDRVRGPQRVRGQAERQHPKDEPPSGCRKPQQERGPQRIQCPTLRPCKAWFHPIGLLSFTQLANVS